MLFFNVRKSNTFYGFILFSASMVMIGSLFAGHEESPGETVVRDGKMYKEYFGSAF
ncbi:GMP reductase OS=Ureibacillus acetophenoni OX=614649 GN=guaC PE=3 SV=1 [Ureibacillus acetophenoni]